MKTFFFRDHNSAALKQNQLVNAAPKRGVPKVFERRGHTTTTKCG